MANSIKDGVCNHVFKAGLRKKYLSGRPCWIWSWPQGWVHTRRAWMLSSWPPHIGHAVCVDHISPRGLHSVPHLTKEQRAKLQWNIILQSGMECLEISIYQTTFWNNIQHRIQNLFAVYRKSLKKLELGMGHIEISIY